MMFGMGRLSGERRKHHSEEADDSASSHVGRCVEIDMRHNPGLARSAYFFKRPLSWLAVLWPLLSQSGHVRVPLSYYIWVAGPMQGSHTY